VDSETPTIFYGLHFAYTFVFVVEIALRIGADGCKSFFCRQWEWHILDLFIVATSILEAGLDIAHIASGSNVEATRNMSNVRIVRVLRIARIGRTLRIPRIIRFVSALRTLVHSIFVTLRSLVWTMILLLLIIYIFGIIFTQSVSEHRGQTEGGSDPRLVDFWGTIPVSMLTLFQAITGGMDWKDCVRPLRGISSFLVAVFVGFIFFTYFAVLNVVTGIFCNSALETSQRNPELIVQSLVSNKQEYIEKITDLFKEIDTDTSGDITVAELEKILTDEKLKAYFEALGLEVEDAWQLFKLIDTKRVNTISLNDFIDGCMRLKGVAKGIDVAIMMSDHRWLLKKLSKFMRYVEGQFDALSAGSSTLPTHPDAHSYRESNAYVRLNL